MRLQSIHTPKAYLAAMKERMGSRFAIGSERFTGTFIGRVFYVTHHAGYEWDRRYTCQRNAALGYLRKTESGSEVCFLTFQGFFCPSIFVPYLLLFAILLIFAFPGISDMPGLLIVECIIALGSPLVYTAIEITTDGSIEGRKSLLGLLADPADFFAYLNHQKDLR